MRYMHHLGTRTLYEDVNDIVQFFTEGTIFIFQENLTGVYLTGSLSYEAFNYDRSDIDLAVILQHPASANEIEAIRRFHAQIEEKFSKWARRLERSYTPVEMLASVLPPKKPRPWYWGGEGILYEEAAYRNEWIINNYLLYNHAIPLVGPDFKELTGPIDIEEVQKACLRDLFKEWVPKKANHDWFENGHHESYFILSLCRILYTVMRKSAVSKKTAALRVKRRYGEPWKDVISAAEQWQDGTDLNLREKAIEFIDFVIDQISKTALYCQLVNEINTCSPMMKTKSDQPEQEKADRQWIEARLRSMTLPEKIGQMIFLNLTTEAMAEKAGTLQRLEQVMQTLHIGGLKIQGGDFHDYVPIANALQESSATPLLFCGDFERGVGERFEGAVRFPPAMALGAIADPDFTRQVGRAIAEESRAAGIPVLFAPVVDVNTRFDNPVINVRSFGENPALVARHAVEFIRGAQAAGGLATAKHFPGHGEVSNDSHLHVAQSPANLAHLLGNALVPFVASIEAGVDLVISAHIALPNLGMPATLPATLSYSIMTELLRHRLRYQGAIMTDSMEMWPISKHYSPAEAAAQAVIAGADIVLDVLDAQAAVQGILAQVSKGAISLARIDASVRRILALKTKAGLPHQVQLNLSQIQSKIGKPETQALARETAKRSLTLLRDEKKLLPLRFKREDGILLLEFFAAGDQFPAGKISAHFQALGVNAQTLAVSGDTVAAGMEHILAVANKADLLVWNLFIGPTCYSGKIGMPATLAAALRRLQELRKPTIAISFGDPYIYLSIPFVEAYLCAYDETEMIQDAAFAALTGRAPISGKLPVTIPGHAKAGEGIARGIN